MAVFLVIIGFIGHYSSMQLEASQDALYSTNLLGIKNLYDARPHVRVIEKLMIQAMLPQTTPEQVNTIHEEIKSRRTSLDKALEAFEMTGISDYEKGKLSAIRQKLDEAKLDRENLMRFCAEGKKDDAYTLFQSHIAPRYDTINGILRELADYKDKEAVGAKHQAMLFASTMEKTIWSITLIAVIIAILIGMIISRMITKPLVAVMTNLSAIADGKLSVPLLDSSSRDEMGHLAASLNATTISLRSLIEQCSQAVDLVSASSQELTASSSLSSEASLQITSAITKTAENVEKQLYEVNDASTMVEQISTGIQLVADNAVNVAGMAEQTAQAGDKGQQSINRAITQMENIGGSAGQVDAAVNKLADSSKQIGEIVNVISGIAAQINLLALNAAIEAARAGEQGRGFAVVAEEVRKLAEQSQIAAKEITDLIHANFDNIENAVVSMKTSIQDVTTGISVVNEAGEAFSQIASLVYQVSSQVSDISASVQEMASSSQQVASTIHDIGQTSKNTSSQIQYVASAAEEQSASMEEIATASQSLANLAKELQNTVRKFTL